MKYWLHAQPLLVGKTRMKERIIYCLIVKERFWLARDWQGRGIVMDSDVDSIHSNTSIITYLHIL
jgi:hypothetical protein